MRVFKTRPLATDACRAGSVEINGLVAKPAREVHAGEVVVVRLGLFTRTLRVVGVPRSRVGAKLVPEFCVDLTPPEEFEKLRERSVQAAKMFDDGSLDFVYLDGNHAPEAIREDMAAWLPKVKKGGIFCGDDFQAPAVCRTVAKLALKEKKQMYVRSNYWRFYDWSQPMNT